MGSNIFFVLTIFLLLCTLVNSFQQLKSSIYVQKSQTSMILKAKSTKPSIYQSINTKFPFQNAIFSIGTTLLAVSQTTPALAAVKLTPSNKGLTKLLLSYQFNIFTAVLFFMLVGYFSFRNYSHGSFQKLEKEIVRANKLHEEMYFEAVSDLMKKLAEPELKNKARERILADMREIDPKGEIRAFLENKGPRPDLSSFIGSSKKKAKKSPSQPPIKNVPPTPPMEKRVVETSIPPPSVPLNNKPKIPEIKKIEPTTPPAQKSPYEILDNLNEILEGTLPVEARRKLVTYLKNRLDQIKDETKKEKALSKIAEKLQDKDYWKNYYKNIKQ